MELKVCNICGKKFDILDANESFNIHKKLGYGTKYDGEILDLNICCSCMDELISKCKKNPCFEENYHAEPCLNDGNTYSFKYDEDFPSVEMYSEPKILKVTIPEKFATDEAIMHAHNIIQSQVGDEFVVIVISDDMDIDTVV